MNQANRPSRVQPSNLNLRLYSRMAATTFFDQIHYRQSRFTRSHVIRGCEREASRIAIELRETKRISQGEETQS